MADSEISQRTDQHASVQKHDISIWLEHDIYMKPLQFNAEAILKCPGLDFLEMSGFEVQKSLC
jgi:hypothetical protein